ncbi:metallophosphoesterase [Natrialbaceae archaeon A-arb3/5]
MNIGIISDTHDNVEAAERAAEIFTEEGVEIVIHCGDFIAPPLLSTLEGFEVHGVLGNNDGEVSGLEAAFDDLGNESELHGRFASLEFDGLSFAVLHGESKAEVETLAAAEEYDVVCYGHHHERDLTEVGRTTRLNPGAHFPSTHADHQTVAIVDTRSESVRFQSVLE